jgi:multiple sugar transport system permease protein
MLGANKLSVTPGQVHPASKRPRFKVSRLWIQFFLMVGSLFMAYPLIYVLLASISTQKAFTNSTWIPIPDSFYTENYTRFFSGAGQEIGTWIMNTLIRVAWYIIVPGTVAVLCGYVFARLHFRGRDTVFIILLSSMMVPPVVFLIPTYIMLAHTPLAGGNDITGQGGHGFVNEWPALLLPGLVNAFYIFFMRQSLQTIPADFEEAARVDGANTGQVIIRIYLPMLKAALTVLVIFQFVAIWNDYLWPLIAVTGNRSIYPVALGFQKLIQIYTQANAATSYPAAFTLGALATIPTIVLFLFLQRYFIEGVQGFGLKG